MPYFLTSSRIPRALHSFPTRRSSDLGTAACDVEVPCVEQAHREEAHEDDRQRQDERADLVPGPGPARGDRKSTRLNSSHTVISYAVFCLKKKKNPDQRVPHADNAAPH